MTVVFLLGAYGAVCAICGSLGTHRWHRAHTANAEHRADMCDWFRDAADRQVDRVLTLEHALNRPRKRRIPGDTQ